LKEEQMEKNNNELKNEISALKLDIENKKSIIKQKIDEVQSM
jgi:hypothetical protein